MSIQYLPAMSEDQTTTDAYADIPESEVEVPEGHGFSFRLVNEGGSNTLTYQVLYRLRSTAAEGDTGLSAWNPISSADLAPGAAAQITQPGYGVPLVGAVKVQVKAKVSSSQTDCSITGKISPVSY